MTIKLKDIAILIFAIIGFVTLLSSFNNQTQEYDAIILKLMGKKLESAYIIDDGREDKVRGGLTGDQALEDYLANDWEIKGTSVASDAGRFSIVYTLIRKK